MIVDCGFLIDDVTERLAIVTSHFKNQQPSGARQPAAGSPEGEAGGPRQSSIGNQG
jgi:hypothetical protein